MSQDNKYFDRVVSHSYQPVLHASRLLLPDLVDARKLSFHVFVSFFHLHPDEPQDERFLGLALDIFDKEVFHFAVAQQLPLSDATRVPLLRTATLTDPAIIKATEHAATVSSAVHISLLQLPPLSKKIVQAFFLENTAIDKIAAATLQSVITVEDILLQHADHLRPRYQL